MANDALAEFTDLFTCGPVMRRCTHLSCPSTPILLGYTKDVIQYGCSYWHYWEIERHPQPKLTEYVVN